MEPKPFSNRSQFIHRIPTRPCVKDEVSTMITFSLVALFVIAVIAVAISLGDSILRGARAFRRLSAATQLDRADEKAVPAAPKPRIVAFPVEAKKQVAVQAFPIAPLPVAA
ncbi:hypothetical protein [Pontixanthobacter aquaemixtae]|uniref:Uncharacterized protein n=1 Tax=Pontixanthobacter aquaemixtae TaxID=1958940 RepID=A0A844ZS53_9SPHN|nr:hypothetical protein [Pontixanthobacter aquaemixtae]MXO89826.1 hypothetical protein [Pontixanthobacter aquaemixtae]